MTLEHKQQKLQLTLVNYNLEEKWNSHELIEDLRKRIIKYFPKGLYDPQDLEHQVLFRLTTFDPNEISEEIIEGVVEEQYLIILDRLKNTDYDLQYLFRGLIGNHKDLNSKNRLELKRKEGKITAEGNGCIFEVEFKVVKDEKIINLFTSELHYMHQGRPRGETFGLFFKNDDIPFAIETTEPAIISKEYKQESLLAQGIDPNKAIELTRFYTLPGSPINSISIMDGLVSKYYRPKGIEALFTTTMPMYSKTKSTTIAGGMNQVLLIKPLVHTFIPIIINGKKCYRQVTSNYLEKNNITQFIKTNTKFPTMFTVEVFMKINKLTCEPLKVLNNKVIKIDTNKKITKLLKFEIKSISDIINLLSKHKFIETKYEKNTIYLDGKKKIQLIVENNFNSQKVFVIYKYPIQSNANSTMIITEIIYEGDDIQIAKEEIKNLGNFLEQNSYEKINALYEINKVVAKLETLPFGAYLTLEGNDESIIDIAKKLGFDEKENIKSSSDECYLNWNEKINLPKQQNITFGFKEILGDKNE